MSVPFTMRQAAEWADGELLRGDAERSLDGVSIDTRTVRPGQLFAAIVGPTHDAHAYLDKALAGGAAGLLVERERSLPGDTATDLPVVVVDDTTLALGALAAGHRRGYAGPLVAITGSNGKTTTKEMCAAILSQGGACLKNPGNLNNHFGLPLTLLSRSEDEQRIVVELGMNHRGEIASLAAIAAPTVGTVTNVGTAHIEHLRSREAIAAEKGDLLAAISADGTAVVPADDDFAATLAARFPGRVVRFGRSDTADVRCSGARAREPSGFGFELASPWGSGSVEVTGIGETTISNALCAAAACLAAGATLEEVAAGLAAYVPVSGRLERRDLPGDLVLIDDSYNANPQSLAVALRSLADAQPRGRRIAVLGDMGELGDASDTAHHEAGRLAAELGIDVLYAVGANAATVAEGAAAGGMPASSIHTARSSDEAGEIVRGLLRPGDWILIKGSRSMRMERVTRHLEAEARN